MVDDNGGDDVKFWLPLVYEPPEMLLDLALMAEELGFEGVGLADHVVIPDSEHTPHPSGAPVPANDVLPDPLLWIAAMAAVTTRLRFLSYVYVLPLRDPFVIAKQVGTLAAISDNRFVLGTGVGWLREEFEILGRDFSTRGRRTDEILRIVRDFLDDGYAEFHGEFFDFERSGMFPFPDQQVPIWIGGHSRAAARRAAPFDGYIPMRGLDEETKAEYALIDEIRGERGLTGPFEKVTTLAPGEGADTVRRLEETEGITSMLVWLWPMNDPTVSLDQKRAAATVFAETVMEKS